MFLKFNAMNGYLQDSEFTTNIWWNPHAGGHDLMYNLYDAFSKEYLKRNKNPIPNLIMLGRTFWGPNAAMALHLFMKDNFYPEDYEKYWVLL